MAWSAVGVSHGGSGGNLSLDNQAVGNLLIAVVVNYSNNTVWCTGFTGGGATWTTAGAHFAGTNQVATAAAFLGTVTDTGAQTATLTWSGATPGNYQYAAFEFHSTMGSWFLDQVGHLDSSGTANMPSLTPAHGAGELYFGYCEASGSMNAGSTSGYVYNTNVDSFGNGSAYNLSCPDAATSPAWAAGNLLMGAAVLVKESQASGLLLTGFP